MSRERPGGRRKKAAAASADWLMTYGDMVTLLLTFFILLYTFSTLDIQRFQEIMAAIQHSFMGRTGILQGSTVPTAVEGQPPLLEETEAEEVVTTVQLGDREAELLQLLAELERVYELARDYLRAAGLSDAIQLRMEKRGIVMVLPEHITFDTGRAELREDVLPVLDLIAGFIAKIPNQIIVEGHTDNVPISTFLFPSNWELSVIRAVSVARYLVEARRLNPMRFVATGYGEYHPIAGNETAQGRARNRRVNIVISINQFK
jgi:chemotaxis protein MotB